MLLLIHIFLLRVVMLDLMYFFLRNKKYKSKYSLSRLAGFVVGDRKQITTINNSIHKITYSNDEKYAPFTSITPRSGFH